MFAENLFKNNICNRYSYSVSDIFNLKPKIVDDHEEAKPPRPLFNFNFPDKIHFQFSNFWENSIKAMLVNHFNCNLMNEREWFQSSIFLTEFF